MKKVLLPLLCLLSACGNRPTSCTDNRTGETYTGDRWNRGIQLKDRNGFYFWVDHSNGDHYTCQTL